MDPAMMPADAAAFANDPERRIDRYVVVELLGSGSSGEVWRAWDTNLRRWTALKRLKHRSPDDLARFRREAQLTARLAHPGIAAVYEARDDYIVMQYIAGRTLSVRDGDLRRAVDLVRQAAQAVDYAHEQGIVHRDLKPGNILIDEKGRAVVTDFGLAKSTEAPGLTATNMVVGTPAYMAPEQARGVELGRATDVYALGATLYELATGAPPFRHADVFELLRLVVEEEPAPPRVDRDLDRVILKCLRKEPRQRYARAADLADDLGRWLHGQPVRARPLSAGERAVRIVRRHPAVLTLATLVAIAGAVLAVQAVRARAELREQEARMRREQEGLARLSSLWSSITERKREMRAGRVTPERGIAELRAAVAEVDRVPGPQARYVRGRARLYLGDRRGAEEDARAVLAAMPDGGPAWAMLGMILLEDHREGLYGAPPGLELRKRRMARVMERALDAFRRAGPPPSGWGLTPVREDAVLRTLASACGRFYVEHDEDGARAALTAAMAEYQSEEYAEVLATWASMPESVGWYRRAIRLAPGYAKAHADLGAALAQLGDLAGARAALDEALRLDPSYVAAIANRGNVRTEQGDAGALDDYDRAIAMRPQAAGLYSMRGKYRLRRGGDLEAAAADFEQAVALDPETPEAHSGLGLSAGGRGDFRAAAEHFTRAIDLYGSYAEAYVNRASVRVQMGDLAGARADCDRTIELDPAMPAAWLNRGSIRLTQGDAAGAVQDLERALQLAPQAWPHRATAEGLLRRARGR